MLVLVRKTDESLVIGGDIVVTVLGIDGDRVKLGIQAPREVAVLRQELCEEVAAENRAALSSRSLIRRAVPNFRP